MFGSVKRAAKDFQARQSEKKAAKEEQKNQILSGNIPIVHTDLNLPQGEQVYFEAKAQRMALIEYEVEETTGKTKRKGTIRRAVVGGALLGVATGGIGAALGAVGGAVTAKGKTKSKTTTRTVKKKEKVDQGRLVFTSKRVMFVGNEVISIPYSQIIEHNFSLMLGSGSITIKYQDMLEGEYYQVSGARDAEIIYQGITNPSRST